jgi:FkbM family methyltransferase
MANRDCSLAGLLSNLARIGWTPGAIIDIGVATGTEGLYSIWPGVPICLVEPSPVSAQFLDEIAGKFPNVVTYKVGASNYNGTMKVRTDPTGVYTYFGDKPHWAEIDVPVMKVDDIVRDAAISGPFVYKLDTDAHELEILKGSVETLRATDVAAIEVHFMNPFYPGAMTPADVVLFMRKRGFEILDMTAIAYSSAHIGRAADMLFAKRDSELFRMVQRNSHKQGKVRPVKLSV